MYKSLVGIGTALLLLGACSSKEATSLKNTYQKKQNYYKLLQKTEKLQIKDSNLTKVLLTVTYLNEPVTDKKDISDERFLVGVYSEDINTNPFTQGKLQIQLKDVKTKLEQRKEQSIEKKERKQKLLSLKENHQERVLIQSYDKEVKAKKSLQAYLNPMSIKAIPKENPLLNEISFVSDWNQFYLISFKHIAGNRLLIQVKSQEDNETTIGNLNFAKVAKYAL